MIAGHLRHELPQTVPEAVALLARAGANARVLSGGTWLVPELTRGAISASTVVDLARIDLPPVRREDDSVVVSATATYADILASDEIRDSVPLLRTVAAGITGGAQIRNVGTLVGSACRASPASDAPTCLMALCARVRLAGPDGVRETGACGFFGDGAPPDIRAGELVTELVFAAARYGDHHGYVKVKHTTGSWPIVTAAFASRVATGRAVLAIGGLAAAPCSAIADLGDAAAVAALPESAVSAAGEPWSDVLADATYRARVAPVAARRAMERAGVA